jgi:Maltokinase N-terminal cap domain
MALVHQATLTPSKLELLAAWLPSRSWFHDGGELTRLGSYRFDDPADEVGIEVMIVQSGELVFQIPLTYRGAPLVGAEMHLLGTMQHSVLGPRWIYDGCGDPVAVRALITAMVTGASQSDVEVESEGQMVTMPPSVVVRGSGVPGSPVSAIESVTCHQKGNLTRSITHAYTLDLVRVIGFAIEAPIILTGSWDEQPSVTLAGLTPNGQ